MTTDYYARHLASEAYRESRLPKAELIAEICEPWIGGVDRIFDLGAGTGLIRGELEALLGRPVIGFEIEPGAITNRHRMVASDLLELPLRDASVAFGIANHVYEHVADIDRLFGELRRILATGGRVYLTAGNRFAILEPHYRIPTLSWWPQNLSSRLLQVSGRGTEYSGIAFKTHREILRAAHRQGLRIRDLTDDVLKTMLSRYEGRVGRVLGRAGSALPDHLRATLLRYVSPQWFFLIERVEDR